MRSAFTLVELLVVTTIIAILISLLIPAVQAAREAARQAQCQNNLKQLGLALYNYENSTGVLPPGAFYTNTTTTGNGSILVRLLPFAEQQALYDNYNFNLPVEAQYIIGTTTEIRSTIIPGFLCPSDPDAAKPFSIPTNDIGGGWKGANHRVGLSNYVASAGPSSLANNASCSCATSAVYSNAYAMSNWVNKTLGAGPFTLWGISASFSDITDGLSNTIFMGEIRPLCSINGERGWEESADGNGLTSTVVPMNYDTCSRDSSISDSCHRNCNWGTIWGFRSRHPGGVHFLFGDGAVRLLRETMDHQTYQYLGAKADGHVASF